jgi:tyrosinase
MGQPGDALDWYGRAVDALRTRPLTDPTSWRYLAAVHGYLLALDPNPTNVPFPSLAEQQKFWNQCQHQTWYFLPWHRAYLACFEQIIADAVTTLHGPEEWALPYWNYSDQSNNNQARLLPSAFVNPSLPTGAPNPLYVKGRNSTTANFNIPDSDVSLHCLTYNQFTGSSLGTHPGFGGPWTGFSHGGSINGGLEDVPHNQIHDDIGGIMGDPRTAALDPIFWLHHANIDRLWEVWWKTRGNANPSDPAWLTNQSFEFHGAASNILTFTASQLIDTTKVLHGYVYDDISDPIAPNPVLTAMAQMVAPPASPDAQVVGALTDVVLNVPQITVPVAFQANAPRLHTRFAEGRPLRAFLNLEHVTGTGPLPKYDVFIDAPPPGQQTSGRAPLQVGSLSLFGVQAASERDGPQGGSGITSVIEISPQVEQLRREGRWDDSRLLVTFIKRDVGAWARTPLRELKIGRISVYYA